MAFPETPLPLGGKGFPPRKPILNVKRRDVLLGMLSVGLSSVCGLAAANTAKMSSLASVVDVLLPADNVSPSASALGVDRDVHDFVAESEMLTRLFETALDWMDKVGDKPFSNLAPSEQVEVLTFMASADFNAVPGRFYHILRALAVEFYYARAEAVAGFPLDPAPQPNGYPPPWG